MKKRRPVKLLKEIIIRENCISPENISSAQLRITAQAVKASGTRYGLKVKITGGGVIDDEAP